MVLEPRVIVASTTRFWFFIYIPVFLQIKYVFYYVLKTYIKRLFFLKSGSADCGKREFYLGYETGRVNPSGYPTLRVSGQVRVYKLITLNPLGSEEKERNPTQPAPFRSLILPLPQD